MTEYCCEKCGYIITKPEKFWISDIYKYMFCDENNNLLLNQIIKFENMYQEWEDLFDRFNIKLPKPIKDMTYYRNASIRKSYQEYYDEELKNIIYEKDQFIFDTYGYSF